MSRDLATLLLPLLVLLYPSARRKLINNLFPKAKKGKNKKRKLK